LIQKKKAYGPTNKLRQLLVHPIKISKSKFCPSQFYERKKCNGGVYVAFQNTFIGLRKAFSVREMCFREKLFRNTMFIPEIYQLTNCQIKKVFRTCSAFELYVQDNKCQSQVPQRLGKCKRVETLVKKI